MVALHDVLPAGLCTPRDNRSGLSDWNDAAVHEEGHFGFIHLFALLVLYSVPAAYYYVRKGNIAKHRQEMIGLYIGGLLIAGSFAFMPGRLMNQWLFQW